MSTRSVITTSGHGSAPGRHGVSGLELGDDAVEQIVVGDADLFQAEEPHDGDYCAGATDNGSGPRLGQARVADAIGEALGDQRAKHVLCCRARQLEPVDLIAVVGIEADLDALRGGLAA